MIHYYQSTYTGMPSKQCQRIIASLGTHVAKDANTHVCLILTL